MNLRPRRWISLPPGQGFTLTTLSQIRLCQVYQFGMLGARKDYVESYAWYRLAEAALKPLPSILSRTERLKLRMTPAQLAEVEKRIAAYKAAHLPK